MKDYSMVKFWDTDKNREELHWRTKEEALEAYLDTLDPPHINKAEFSVGDKIILYGYTEMPIGIHLNILENVLEDLDEEHGNPNGPTTPTVRMIEAEKEFERVILEEYENYWGECTVQMDAVYNYYGKWEFKEAE